MSLVNTISADNSPEDNSTIILVEEITAGETVADGSVTFPADYISADETEATPSCLFDSAGFPNKFLFGMFFQTCCVYPFSIDNISVCLRVYV